MDYTVIRKKSDTYDIERLEKLISDIFEELKFNDKFDLKGKRVLIKPNLVSPLKPEKAVTTHPAMVEAVVKNLKKWVWKR